MATYRLSDDMETWPAGVLRKIDRFANGQGPFIEPHEQWREMGKEGADCSDGDGDNIDGLEPGQWDMLANDPYLVAEVFPKRLPAQLRSRLRK